MQDPSQAFIESLDFRKYAQKFSSYKKLYTNNYLYGGSYPLYVQFSRLRIANIKDDDAAIKKLINDALKMNRYIYNFYDLYGKVCELGIDPGRNLDDDKTADPRNIGIEGYESSLIREILYELNDLLTKYKIITVQSQPSYYINHFSSSPYLQLPYVEFSGDKNTIPVLKAIVNYPTLRNYYAMSFSEIYKNVGTVRLTIMRPYVNDDNKILFNFDDSEFWRIVVDAVKNISNLDIKLSDFISNDPELDMKLNWYILDDRGHVKKIQDKSKMNPYVNGMPLSTLNVRYGPDKKLFMRKL